MINFIIQFIFYKEITNWGCQIDQFVANTVANFGHCHFLNVVTFDYSRLYLPLTMNILSVTSEIP